MKQVALRAFVSSCLIPPSPVFVFNPQSAKIHPPMPVKFEIFRDGKRLSQFQPTAPYAQDLFSEALTKLEDPPTAASLADESLSRAILLSEELAMFHMELLVNRRRQTGAFVRHIFGCRVDSSVQNARYRDMLSGNFD